MKFLLSGLGVITVLLLIACGSKPQASSQEKDQEKTASGCGIERWNVKTLKDSAAREINFKPIVTTIQNLNLFRPPKSLTIRQNEELLTYRVSGNLVKFKEEDDGDIHAIISSGGKSLIAEMPNVRCTYGSFHRYQMYAARSVFQTLFGSPSSRWRYMNKPITISGVAFYDFPHGQSGHADNYIELHPVLGVK